MLVECGRAMQFQREVRFCSQHGRGVANARKMDFAETILHLRTLQFHLVSFPAECAISASAAAMSSLYRRSPNSSCPVITRYELPSTN